MQVTSLLSRRNCAQLTPEEELAASQQKLRVMFVGIVLVSSSVVLDWFQLSTSDVAGLLSLLGSIVLGYRIIWNSVNDLRQGVVSINELVSVAVLVSFATGDYRTAGVVAFFMILGEIIETRTAAGARASIESLIELTPNRARKLDGDGTEHEIETKDLKVGDIVRVRPGDNIPADGIIVTGASSINQASITGESLPVDKRIDEEVFAGTINLTGALEFRVTRAGEDTTLGRVRELILNAEQSKLPIMRIMDRYMGYYTPLVLTMGALVWVFTHDLNRLISVLVVSCPCAFVLATPSAMVAALSAGARLGVLIKNVGDIEVAARIKAFVFDKTGTLTTGQLAVSRLKPLGETTAADLVRLAASVESHSNHPTARALVTLGEEVEAEPPPVEEFSETAGRGVKGIVEGRQVLAGRAQWLQDNGVSAEFMESVDLVEAEGFSLIFIACDGHCIGWFGLQDQTRTEAADALAELRTAGVKRIAMVTGDRRSVADRVAKGIQCEEISADCLPQDKVDFVHRVREEGYQVAVVGDGVNDAPALASGDLGIAMGAAGSEVAIHSASIALMNNDLRRLPFLVSLSRATRTVINQNFLIGLVFILVGLSTAALGYLNPIVAAILHNAGSILVVFNSARLVRQGEELESSGLNEQTSTPTRLEPQPAA